MVKSITALLVGLFAICTTFAQASGGLDLSDISTREIFEELQERHVAYELATRDFEENGLVGRAPIFNFRNQKPGAAHLAALRNMHKTNAARNRRNSRASGGA
ncbi:hypothetical protein DFP72DRAFT_1074566 [Ephemerocybe angulata]|uniref:Uncharacterized protein n=1 Tax=Ephemerocybe angulata TaxID=980116 RepID=A0A8H6M0T5_9AGAR|nr:hypothetical protein DFP72DRAFT_1074566 [Tulosesus angulatus]